jgi:hypothetical protein
MYVPYPNRVSLGGTNDVGIQLEAEPGGEADTAEQAKGVVLEGALGRKRGADQPGFQVR